MKNLKSTFFILIFLLSVVSCTRKEEKPLPTDKNAVVIGTYNIEWLGDGINDRIDRTEDDYQAIAKIIAQTGADVLGIQEVENPEAIKRVLKYLPDFSFILGKHGGKQNVGLLYKKDIDIKYIGEYFPLEVEYNRTRPGLMVSAKKGNFEWVMMVVHLKSSSHFDNTEEKKEESHDIRLAQSKIITNWADSIIAAGNEKNIIIVGDFNDTPVRKKEPALESLANDNNLIFLTAELKSCKFKSMYVIDQIIVSKKAEKRFIPGSLMIYNTFNTIPIEQQKNISDHCPIVAKFDVTALNVE